MPLVSRRVRRRARCQQKKGASNSHWHQTRSRPAGRCEDPGYSSRTCPWAFGGFPSALPCSSGHLCMNWAVWPGQAVQPDMHINSHRLWAHGTSKRSCARAQPSVPAVSNQFPSGGRKACISSSCRALSLSYSRVWGWCPSEVRVFASCHGISLRNCPAACWFSPECK